MRSRDSRGSIRRSATAEPRLYHLSSLRTLCDGPADLVPSRTQAALLLE
jgi:hypothetical protein